MNEEEKKTVNLLKQTIDHNSSMYIDNLGDNDIKIILNLIEKQQKEIEELKETLKCTQNSWYRDTKKIEELKDKQDYARLEKEQLLEDVKKYYIKKDKIKEKIKELESHIWKDGYMTKFDEYAIHYLQELLGE